jgi:hypothetical protein
VADPKRQATEIELAYLAGIVDGEGCICLCETADMSGRKYRREGDTRFRSRLYIKMVDPEAALLAYEVFGGGLCVSKPRTKANWPQITWTVTERRAARAIQQLLPYLLIKTERAKFVIKMAELCARHQHIGRGYRVSKEELDERRKLIEINKLHNSRSRLLILGDNPTVADYERLAS